MKTLLERLKPEVLAKLEKDKLKHGYLVKSFTKELKDNFSPSSLSVMAALYVTSSYCKLDVTELYKKFKNE